MSMTYYQNYLNHVSKTPYQEYRNGTEAYIQSQWQDTTLLVSVQEEIALGTFSFRNIEVWKNTVTEFQSNIIKNEKDFRRLMFQLTNYQSGRGLLYQFDNNYWIVYEGTNYEEPYSDVLVRRCNNIAKWVDSETGEIVEIPCVLEYDIASTNPKINKDIIQANGSLTMVLQGNQKTLKLKKNQRFIFNGVPYKFVAYNNYMQTDYVDKSTPLLFMDLDFDVEKPTDDINNNIADRYLYEFSVNVNENPQQQVQGFVGNLTANVTLNGALTDNIVTWSSNENGTILQNGQYNLIGAVGSIATFTATFGSFTASVNIEIVSSVVVKDEIVISPEFDELYQGENLNFTVFVYHNGVKQLDSISYTTSGASNSCYSIIQSGNNFTLSNLMYSTIPLTINFASASLTKTMQINLRALF